MEERFKLFTLLITDLFKNIKRLRTEEMAKYDLKSIHLSCLHYIYIESAISLKELCVLCRDDKANVSRSIKTLIARGYVVTLPEENGKFALTEEGIALTEKLEKKINSVLQKAGCGLDEKQREIMYSGLSIINNNLFEICENYKEIGDTDE